MNGSVNHHAYEIAVVVRAVLLLTSAAPIFAGVDAAALEGSLSFLAATSTWNRTDTFPANLYQLEKGKLRLVQAIIPSTEGTAFVRHYEHILVIGSPHVRPTRLYLVDAQSRTPNVSSIPLVYPENLVMTTEVFLESSPGPLRLAYELTSGNTTGPVTRRLDMILLSPPLSLPNLIKNAQWPSKTELRVSGSTGGPLDQGDSANCIIRGGQVGYPSPLGFIRLAPAVGSPVSNGDEDCTIVGSNQLFLVYIRSFQSIEQAIAAKQKVVEIYNRSTHRTSKIEVQGAFSRVMLDGKWLVVTTVESNPERRINPGIEGLSIYEKSPLTPPVEELFATSQPPQYFPGTCFLHDLESGKTFAVKTGQADTEILGIVDNKLIYRIQTRLIMSDLEGKVLGNTRTLAEDPNILAIHWMLINTK